MKILITGAEGNVCNGGFTAFFEKSFRGKIYLTDIKKSSKRNFIRADLTEKKQIKKLPEDIYAVIHMATLGLPAEISEIYRVNLFSTLNLLEYYKKFNLKKFIFLSSVCVYGLPNTGVFPDYLPIDEKHPEKTVDHYGMSKSIVEKLLYNYSKIVDFQIIILRAGSVITEKQNTYEYRENLIKNDRNYRKGGELWNFVDYRDLARGIKTVLKEKTGNFEIFNFTSDDHLMKETNSELINFISYEPKIKSPDFLKGRSSFFDNSKFKNYFKFNFLFPASRYYKFIEENKKGNYYFLKK